MQSDAFPPTDPATGPKESLLADHMVSSRQILQRHKGRKSPSADVARSTCPSSSVSDERLLPPRVIGSDLCDDVSFGGAVYFSRPQIEMMITDDMLS